MIKKSYWSRMVKRIEELDVYKNLKIKRSFRRVFI